jgi:hypothetical protein
MLKTHKWANFMISKLKPLCKLCTLYILRFIFNCGKFCLRKSFMGFKMWLLEIVNDGTQSSRSACNPVASPALRTA